MFDLKSCICTPIILIRDCTQLPNQPSSVNWVSFHHSQPYTNSLSHVAVSSVHAKHLLLRFNLVVYWIEPITILKALNLTGQPAHLEEQKFYRYLPTHPNNQMAGPRTHHNPPLGGKDELAGAPTKGNSIPAISHAPTPAPA